jgi:hypothetical protein
MRVITERPPLSWEERPLLDARDCWLAVEPPLLAWLRAFDALWPLALLRRLVLWRPELLRRLDEPELRALELRPLELRPLEELARELREPEELARELREPEELAPELREPEELARALREPDELALLLFPPLRVLPLLPLLPLPRRELPPLPAPLLLDPFAFWVLVRPREVPPRLLPLDELRLLDRLEEPRPLVADIVHLLLVDSHAQTNSAGAGLVRLYPANRAITTPSGQMFDAVQDALLDVWTSKVGTLKGSPSVKASQREDLWPATRPTATARRRTTRSSSSTGASVICTGSTRRRSLRNWPRTARTSSAT